MTRIGLGAGLLLVCLVGCGGAAPLGVAGGAGSAGKGTGSAGATGEAGKGSAGATGTAGAPGSAGATGGAGTTGTGGHGGMSGRVPQKHRATAVACPTERPAGSCTIADGGTSSCISDSDCTAGSNGRCNSVQRVLYGCTCTYDDCTTDADCQKQGGPCECRPAAQGIVAPVATQGNVCMLGNCRVDGDCGAGGYCSPTLGTCGAYGGVEGYYCHTAKDKCVDDGDCAAQGGGDCRYDTTNGVWACATSFCAG
jgi:hypothetical protein